MNSSEHSEKKEISGLELAEFFYKEKVFPILEKYFPEIANRHSAALIGHGSEV